MAVKPAPWLWLFLFWAFALSFHLAQAQDQVSLDAKRPLFWADGITQVADLDHYKDLGFNTVVVRLLWTPGPNGEISALDLVPQRAFAEAAAQRGLNIIYALPASPTGMQGSFRLSADSEAYVSLWTAWLQDAVASLRGTTNLIGWMLPDDPRGLPIFDDLGFQRWIAQNYADVGVINRQWHAAFNSLDDVSISDIDQLAALWRGDGDFTDSEKNRLAAGQETNIERHQFGQNWAFHPAALALAHYKWDSYRALLTTWVGALRGEDGAHLVFSGRIPDYAQLLSLPTGIDVVVPDMAPGVAQNDIVTHNPQSMDIARRGGKFGVLPLLSPHEGAQLPASALPDLVRRWMDEACARGARGLGFDSWPDLQDSPELSKAVGQELEKLLKPAFARLWGEEAINTTAVLLTPLADGVTFAYGTPPNQFPRGLFGFGDDLVRGEPSNLVWALKWGTVYGGVDYLSPDDLSEAPLDRYTTILAPQTLSSSPETTAHLTQYVMNGGVLVADLGLGAMQNGGQVSDVPPPLATLFGIPGSYDVRPMTFNLSGFAEHPLLPAWSNLIRERPGISLTLGDGPSSAAFAGPVGFSPVPPVAPRIANGPQLPQVFGNIRRLLTAPLTANPVGRGYAIFAPFRLWTFWNPGQVGFDTFLGDLVSRGATVTFPGAQALVPSPVTAPVGQTQSLEVINRATGVSFSNHDAPGAPAKLMALQTSGAGDWLWSGGLALFTPSASFPVSGGRSAPIINANEFELRARPVTLYAALAPGDCLPMMMRPIAVQNLSGDSLVAQLNLESPKQIKVNVWPNVTTIVAAGEEWQVAVATAAPLRLTVVSSPDGYRAQPGSRHRAIITDYSKPAGKKRFQTLEKLAVADERGRLIFEFSGAACGVEIAPAP